MANVTQNAPKDLWLKVLIGFIITLIFVSVSIVMAGMDKKVDKEIFRQHEKYQNQQYSEIKASLQRIEDKP